MIDPHSLQPGDRLQYKDREPQTVSHRKTVGAGWWLTDGSGIHDKVLTGEWGEEGSWALRGRSDAT